MKHAEDKNEVVAIRLKALRINAGMNQGDMADILNVSRSTISFFENGKVTPAPEYLALYCQYFHVDLNYLYGVNEINEDPVIVPSTSEIKMIEAYRTKPQWMKQVIRTLCFNGETDTKKTNRKK